MTTEPRRHPAEERLLDAALTQLFAERGAPANLATTTPRPRRHASLLAAAVLLLGLGVTAVVLWEARLDEAGPISAQDPQPAPLPARVEARSRAQLEALPADTVNLTYWPFRPEDLAPLRRFADLRRLSIGVFSKGRAATLWQAPKGWDSAPAGCLAPLADLQALEVLHLPGQLHLRAQHLEPLRRCAKLRELELTGENVTVDDAFVAALRRLPGLRALRFDIVRLDAAALKRLSTLPIEELGISRCPGFDAAAFAELCAIATLRRVELGDLGRPEFGDRTAVLWGATADDLRKLENLPALEHLGFQFCVLGGDELRALPASITSLKLGAYELTPDELRELRRFGALRRLELWPRRYGFLTETPAEESHARADAVAAALGGLRLTRLRYNGELTETLLQQLAGQVDLTELRLQTDHIPSLAPLAGLPKLRDLELYELRGPSWLSIDELAPLAASRSLRHLLLHTLDAGITRDELAAALGPDVEVEVETATKK